MSAAEAPNVYRSADGSVAVPAKSQAEFDFPKLADFLEALANPGRLELLHILREPRAVSDIELAPSTTDAASPDRNITRQAVRKQLARLEEAGLVSRLRGEQGAVDEHVVNHQMLFALMEELRRVTRLTPTVGPPPSSTMTAGRADPTRPSTGARVVIVHGAHEGRAFPLRPSAAAEGRGWVIGRRARLAVTLDYDPFLSQEHAEIRARGAGFEVIDLPSNKNGTEINWEPVPRGGAAPLRHGDVIGVGRTLLLFRTE